MDGLLRREPSIDFKRAVDIQLIGVPDAQVSSFAAKENRILVTHDRRTMPSHFAEFILENSCPGVCIVSQSLPVSTAIDNLFLMWAVSSREEWQNLIFDLPF